jgi:SAM-dependent methyltransferase
MSTPSANPDALKDAVREKYAALAMEGESCCGSSEEGDSGAEFDVSKDYADAALAETADLDLGCGRPTDLADLQAGERILDLGAGAGMDAFVARRDVGPEGHVHGVDLAKAMVEKAQANAKDLGYENVTFEQGDIEALPVADETFDVVLSNCVLNLVPDMRAAFGEMYRVLRPGGRFSVSDIVHVGPLPDALREGVELYVGCVAGAMERGAYLDGLRDTGFADVRILTATSIDLPDALLADHLSENARARFRESNAGLQSVTVVGRRPNA